MEPKNLPKCWKPCLESPCEKIFIFFITGWAGQPVIKTLRVSALNPSMYRFLHGPFSVKTSDKMAFEVLSQSSTFQLDNQQDQKS